MPLPLLSQRVEGLVRDAMNQERILTQREALRKIPLPMFFREFDRLVGRTTLVIMREIEKGPGELLPPPSGPLGGLGAGEDILARGRRMLDEGRKILGGE